MIRPKDCSHANRFILGFGANAECASCVQEERDRLRAENAELKLAADGYRLRYEYQVAEVAKLRDVLTVIHANTHAVTETAKCVMAMCVQNWKEKS